jgi:hypothetical protein
MATFHIGTVTENSPATERSVYLKVEMFPSISCV